MATNFGGVHVAAIAEPLLGAMLGAIAIAGCHWWVAMLGCHCRGAMQWVPLLGCHCWATLWGQWLDAIARCHCRMLATNSSGVHVGCHCWAPLLGPIAWVPLWGAMAGCHCWCHCCVPLRDTIARKIDQSVTPFSAALFSALITHKNWLVLSGVYAGIIF